MRTEYSVIVDNADGSKSNVKLVDRICILDLYLNMVDGEIFRVQSGQDVHASPSRAMKDFLIRTRLEVG